MPTRFARWLHSKWCSGLLNQGGLITRIVPRCTIMLLAQRVFGFSILHVIGGTIIARRSFTGCTSARPTWSLRLPNYARVDHGVGGSRRPKSQCATWLQLSKYGGFEVILTGGYRPERKPSAVPGQPDRVPTSNQIEELANVESWEGEKAENVKVRTVHGLPVAEVPADDRGHPEEPQATLPTGYAVDLRLQSEGAEGMATADLREAVWSPRGRRPVRCDGPASVQRSAGRARHRTASGMPKRLEAGAH